VLDRSLAAQVAVERAQAGNLAGERARCDGRALLAAGRQLGQELRQLAMGDPGSGQPAPIEELPELEQVRAVGIERVARQPPLELEIGEEVEDQWLDPDGDRRRGRLSGCHPVTFAGDAVPP
jgi:hypothetical protein